jgi:hypothetical protein
MNKELALSLGGKIWSKDGQELRVYLNKDAVLKLAEGYQITAHEEKAAAKAKTFLDLKTSELKSDVGAVRSLLTNAGYKCVA